MAGMAADNIVQQKVKVVLTAEELSGENVRLLDVRRSDEVAKGAIPGALHIPLDELRDRAEELNPDLQYVVYCRSGLRSYVACRMLDGLGFKQVQNLSGGHVVYEMREQVARSLAPVQDVVAAGAIATP